MACFQKNALCWFAVLAFIGQCEAQELGRHDWSSSRVVSQRIASDMPASARSLGKRLAETNGATFAGETTVTMLAQTLNAIGIPTVIDRNSLEDESVDPDDEKLRLTSASVSLSQSMQLALNELRLGWTLSKRGDAVLIAANSRIEEELMRVTYDVTHLCPTAEDHYPLYDVVLSSVRPDSWDEVGGPGSMRAIEVRGRTLFVVSNTYQVHTEIDRLLNSLRKMGGTGPLLKLSRNKSDNSNLNFSSVGGSTPVAMPTAPKKRGIALPDSKSTGGFGGGMAGGMF